VMSSGIVGIKIECAPKFVFRAGPVRRPTVELNQSQSGMASAKVSSSSRA